MVLNKIVSLLGVSTIKGRLRLSFVSFLVLLIIFSSFPLIFFGKEQRLISAQVELDKLAVLQQEVIDNWLDDRRADIEGLSKLPEFKNQDIQKINNILTVFHTAHSKYESFVYINEVGEIEVDTNGPIGLNISEQPFFLEAKNGDANITDVITGDKAVGPLIIISIPVYNAQNKFSGVIVGTVILEELNKVMANFTDETQEVYLIDSEGKLISESSQGEFGEFIHTETYKKALTEEKSSRFYERKDGEEVLGSYQWVHDKQWLIIAEEHKSTIYSPYYETVAFTLLGFVLAGAFGWAVISWISTQFEFPIRSVLAATRKIGTGKWGYQLDSSEHKNDAKEFQELRHNFNQMSELIENNIKEIAKNEERFRMIAEYSSDMITIHNSLGNYLYVSSAGKEILQYEDDEIVGHDSYDFIHPEDIKIVEENHEKLFLRGYVVVTYRIRKKDGSYIWFESSVKSLEAKNYNEPQIIVISRNITERKQAEEQLREANTTLHTLSMKDGLLGIWNRRAFDEQIEKEWYRAARSSTPLSILILFEFPQK